MCGIAGLIHARRGDLLGHRGPDGGGAFGTTLPWAHVAIEMTRLSIVDRRDLPIPYDFRESVGVVLAYNGEVYNWRALREELSDGTPWQTECDAEVIARGWRRWGVDVLRRLNGMWGLALVDLLQGEVFLARDRAGEKPLYYTANGGTFNFASEIKALLCPLEEVPCRELDVLEFDCLESTPFRGVRRLGPGQYLHLRSPEQLSDPRPVTWWKLPERVEAMTWPAAVDEAHTLIVDAVRLRAQAEVPVGVLLSGGLDSAIVQAVARCDDLYTVDFPETIMETLPDARIVCESLTPGMEPVAVEFDRGDMEAKFPDIAYHLDTPATWTAVCQWFLASRMSQDGIRVVLSGEGADELFAGYARYRLLWHLDRAQVDPVLAAYTPLRRRVLGYGENVLARMLDRSGGQRFAAALDIVAAFERDDASLVERMAHIDFYTTMQVLLRMADTMFAAFGMENRSPFLDYRVMEFAARCPLRWKMNEQGTKMVLRAVARRLGVPDPIVFATTKKGLALPWTAWAKEPGAPWDRSEFATLMRAAWRKAFFGER